MKKVISPRKKSVAMKNFAPPLLSSTFRFEPEQKKTCGKDSHEKETKHIHT